MGSVILTRFATITPAYAAGQTLRYTNEHTAPTSASQYYSGVIASTVVNPAWAAACALGCGAGQQLTQSVPDMALITLKANLSTAVATAKIDTSSLSAGDFVSVAGYGCESNNLTLPSPRHLKAQVTTVVTLAEASLGAQVETPANPDLFRATYAVTRGAAFGNSSSDLYPGACPGDSGAPLFRGFIRPGQDYVVGVNTAVKFDAAQISQVSYHTRVENELGTLSPTILWLRGLLDASSFAAAPHPTQPNAPSVTWTYVGNPSAARDIAACENGYIYALNADKSLYVNKNYGTDSGWVYLDKPTYAQSITCAGVTLYALNFDKSLYRYNQNSFLSKWSYIETMGAAKTFAGNRYRLFAVNTNNTLWSKPTGGWWGQMGTWTKGGSMAGGIDIDVYQGDVLSRLFIVADGVLYMNSANGASGYWATIDYPWDALEIAAADPKVLYALNKNYTLYRGIINQ